MEVLYPAHTRECIHTIYHILKPTIPRLTEAMYVSHQAKFDLVSMYSPLKRIIEEGVYRTFDLNDIVQSQKIVIDLANKIYNEMNYVKVTIQQSMKGKTMTTLINTLEQVMTLINYFTQLTSDCFGNNN